MSNSIPSHYITALKAEEIKKKGTGLYTISALLGAIFPAIVFMNKYFSPSGRGEIFEYSHFFSFLLDSAQPLTIFFLPLLIIIITSRVTQLDHRNGGWQLMETQPIKKWAIYFSKFTVVLFSILITIISFVLFGLLFGWLLSIVKPLPETALLHLPVGDIVQLITRLFVGCLFVAALQYLISVLVPGFIWSIIIGFSVLLGGIILKTAGYYLDWYPTLILARVVDFSTSDLGYWFVYTDYLSIVAAALVLYIGFRWYYHKTFRLAFLHKPSRLLSLVVVLAVSGLVMAFILKPNVMEPYKTTVLAGEIDSEFKVNSIYVTHPMLQDTVAVIPVKDNRFHYTLDTSLVNDYYNLQFENFFAGSAYFGEHDSIYVKTRANQLGFSVKTYGTRLAENQSRNSAQSWSYISYYLDQNDLLDDPARFSTLLHKEWKEKKKEMSSYKTVDNYSSKQDYTDFQEKLLALTYLNYWNSYVKKRSVAFPQDKTEMSEEVKEIQAKVTMNEENLLAQDVYRDYLKYHLTFGNKEDLPEETKMLTGILKLPEGSFKNKLLFYQLQQSLTEAANSKERTALIDQYADHFTSNYYRSKTLHIFEELQRLGKGEPAPPIEATDIAANAVSLADLKGKHVLIDVWATWCGPCKVQWPHFEKLALKYKDAPVHFVALSGDREKAKWELDAKGKSQTVLQWHINDLEKLVKDYNIPGIPRFILIDPNGNFVNVKMPSPSEKVFEIVLRKELQLPE